MQFIIMKTPSRIRVHGVVLRVAHYRQDVRKTDRAALTWLCGGAHSRAWVQAEAQRRMCAKVNQDGKRKPVAKRHGRWIGDKKV